MNFFIKNPNLTKKKKKFWRVGGAGGVARVSDFFFFKRIQVFKFFFSFEGVNVREYWLV